MSSPLACIVNGALLLKRAKLPAPCWIGLFEENYGVQITGPVADQAHAFHVLSEKSVHSDKTDVTKVLQWKEEKKKSLALLLFSNRNEASDCMRIKDRQKQNRRTMLEATMRLSQYTSSISSELKVVHHKGHRPQETEGSNLNHNCIITASILKMCRTGEEQQQKSHRK